MRKKFMLLFVIVFLLVCLFPGSASALEYFDIGSYDVTMNVQENHAYDIREDISVKFTEPRHGIYRYIPNRGSFYREIDGKPMETKYNAKVSDVSVPRFKYKVSSENDNTVIQIGSANKMVSGFETYTINYTWNPGIDNLSSMDDVYYNIIGTNWDTNIKTAKFIINMPASFDPGKVEFITGSYGSTDTTAVDFTVNGNTIEGTLNRPLGPHEGVTLKINLPDGYFTSTLMGNEFELFMYLIFGLSLLFSFLIWFFTRKNEKPVETVEFYPPQKFTPSQIGFIADGYVGNPEVLSLFIYWADQGFMTIEQVNKNQFIFHKLKDLPETALNFEHTLFDRIFGEKNQFVTTEVPADFYKTIETTKEQIGGYFDLPDNQLYTKINLIIFINTIIMSLPLLALVINGAFKLGMLDSFCEGLIYVLGISLFTVLPIVLILSMITSTIRKSKGATTENSTRKITVGILWLVFFIIAVVFVNLYLFKYASYLPVILALATTGGIAYFQTSVNKHTKKGLLWYGQVLGFKNFINLVEKDRIEALVDENPQYFFNILPYAYVLGVSEKWAKNFESMAINPPSWYMGQPYGDTFSTTWFAGEIRNSMSSISSAIIIPPETTSSGRFGGGDFSSGGGFSGGGGGGGGGGSW